MGFDTDRKNGVFWMKYGMPTLIEIEGLENNMKICRTLGLDFLELNMNVPEYQVEALNTLNVSKLKEKYAVDLTMHLPENFCFADFNARMRNAAFEIFAEAADFAKENQIKVLNMHMHTGTFFTHPTEKVYLQKAYKKDYLKHVAVFRDHVEKCLEGTDIKLCVENACDFHHDFIQEGVALLLESDYIDLTWDTGHNIKGRYQDQVFVFQNESAIKHVHLHDCAFGNDHMPLGTGELCMDMVMDRISDSCERIVLESKTLDGLRKSIIHLDVRNKMIAV